MKLSALLVATLAIGCASEPSKQDISNAPISIDEVDAKEDSPTKPSKGHDARIAEQITDKFSKTRGWIAHQIQLTGGRVDVDVSGTEGGDQLDTILYVFGPRKPNGKYPTQPIAFNDDFEPGLNFGSHIILDVPADGIYQVVVSTYENYIFYPRNVSRGTYQLMVKCQDPAFGACGPAVSGIDGQCWADDDCVDAFGKPLHCEGEVTCAPGTQCFFVRLGTCVEDYVYMTFAAKQCGNNPWNVTTVTEEDTAFPVPDLGVIKKHYGKAGVTFDELGQLTETEPTAHCFGCFCARGDQLVVKVKAIHADILAADGWIFSAPSPEAVSLEPKQCGSNPWETIPTSSIDEELELVDTWLAGETAKVGQRGFMYPAEPKAVCASCACPRGDRLVAFPLDQESAGMLASLGFSAVYVP
jgi:hypothetical protein